MKRTEEDIKDILITACEGGVNYWAKATRYDPIKGVATLIEYGDEDKPINTHKLRAIVYVTHKERI